MDLKKMWIFLLLMVFVFSNVSCGTTHIYIEEDAEVLGEIAYMTAVSPQYQISVQIPRFESEKINVLYQTCATEYLKDVFEVHIDLSLDTEDVDIDIKHDYSAYYIDIDCEIVCKADDMISVIFEGIANRKGSAHPTYCFFSLNVDSATEEPILFGDVYTVNDTLYDKFREYAYEALVRKADEQWLNDLDFSKLCPKERFLSGLQEENGYYAFFTQTGVGIAYPVAHSIGDYQKVEIPYAEISGLRK